MNVDEILRDEARTMGRSITLVAAHVFELEVPVAVVVYDCEPLETARVGRPERANTSMIVSTEWRHPETDIVRVLADGDPEYGGLA